MSNPANETAQRREIHFSGRVQGVGFRYTTHRIAGRFEVGGYVQNLSDGRVRLVVEGKPAAIESFVTAVETEMGRCIQQRDSQIKAPTHEFDAFEVRY